LSSPANFRIEKLGPDHDLVAFDCGSPALNRFLQVHALANARSGSAQTYVAVSSDGVIGFHSLTAGEVAYEAAPERLAKGLARHPIPVLILARLAVDRRHQGRRIGAGLLIDALRRTREAAEIVGVRAVLVHAKDEAAKAFYLHAGFEPFKERPLTLYLLLKDVRSQLGN
jgi:GNAT superfamily N-acetyltransferase